MSRNTNGNNVNTAIRELVGTVIYDAVKQTINDIPIHVIEQRLYEFAKLPPGIKAACHRHSKILYFKTIEDLQKHSTKYHDYRKG